MLCGPRGIGKATLAYHIAKMGWEEQNNQIIIRNIFPAPGAGFYLKSYFEQVGGYDTRFPMLEDWPFLYQFITGGNEIVLLDETLVKYRVSEGSLSRSKGSRLMNASCKRFFFLVLLPELLKRRQYKLAWDGFKNYRFL